MQPGPKNLITDVSGLLVGNAADAQIKTGVTVLTADKPFTAAVHVMGGAPGTRETDLLGADKLVQEVDALVLSGGSAFGLAAADGAMAGLREKGRGFQVGDQTVPIVPTAILFDLLNGGNKAWTDNPYPALGRIALNGAASDFLLGTVGAGTGATTCGLKGGLGSASLTLENGLTVGALVAVNALGSAIAGDGPHFLAGHLEMDAEFGGLGVPPVWDTTQPPRMDKGQGEATTIAIVATNAALTQAQTTRMATAAHDGMARALWPSHTPLDGDLVFAAATGDQPLGDPVADQFHLGHAAGHCLARAIARGVHSATPAPGDTHPAWSVKFEDHA